MKSNMKKTTVAAMAAFALFSTNAMAHVTNEKTLYEDLGVSKAQDEILLLTGLGAIHGDHNVSLFKPLDVLTKKDLAVWAGYFHGSESEDVTVVQQDAVKKGYVDSLDGNVTYQDLATAYFGKDFALDKQYDAKKEITKEEAALFLGTYIYQPYNGKTLADMAGDKEGPHGVVEAVEDHVITVKEEKGKKTYTVSHHPKLLNADTDLNALVGKEIGNSWIGEDEGQEVIKVISVGQRHEVTSEPTAQTTSATEKPEKSAEKTTKKEEKRSPVVPIIGVIILAGILYFVLRKKK